MPQSYRCQERELLQSSKPKVLALVSQLPKQEYKSFDALGEAPGFDFSPDGVSPHQGGVSGKNVFQPFLPTSMCFPFRLPDVKGFLFICLFCFLRGNHSICSYRFAVSVGRGEFRIFLH